MNLPCFQDKLLNEFQHQFPLEAKPFSAIAEQMGVNELELLSHLDAFQQQGLISRVGPVFTPNSVGASTLAAIAAPVADLERVAKQVSEYSQVNHNYEREHDYNLWFVLNEKNGQALATTIAKIEVECGYPVLTLPLVQAYHIDLGFDLNTGKQQSLVNHTNGKTSHIRAPKKFNVELSQQQRQLISAIQDGLPLVSRPYQQIGEQIQQTETAVISQIRTMIDQNIIKRMGVIVRHRKLGYRANGMIVWDVPDDHVDKIGAQLGKEARVSLCYQRPRRLPSWGYNLFCMIHGKSRDEVTACVEKISQQHQLDAIPREILFSIRCFKQRGANYCYG